MGRVGSRCSNEPPEFLKSAFLGVEKIKKITQNNQKTVTGRLQGRLLSLPGLSEEAATFWHYNEKFFGCL